MCMVMKFGSRSRAWRKLINMAAETKDAASDDQPKIELKTLR